MSKIINDVISMINAFAKGVTLLSVIPYVVLFLIWLVLRLYGYLHFFPLYSVIGIKDSYEWYCVNFVDRSWFWFVGYFKSTINVYKIMLPISAGLWFFTGIIKSK